MGRDEPSLGLRCLSVRLILTETVCIGVYITVLLASLKKKTKHDIHVQSHIFKLYIYCVNTVPLNELLCLMHAYF